MAKPTIHWCGLGLSALPGLKRLIAEGHEIRIWNRSLDKALPLLKLRSDLMASLFDFAMLERALQPGDLLVSMLPAPMQLPLAQLALRSGAHLLSSSYSTDELQALDSEAVAGGVMLVNECGLDPGLDHWLAYDLVAAWQRDNPDAEQTPIRFWSWCGGLPAEANDFCYKFSWSAVGVLRALLSPARYLRDDRPVEVARPYQDLQSFQMGAESFIAYPNRDCTGYLTHYGFSADQAITSFIRGSLRLPGWDQAWQRVFQTLEQRPEEIEALSAELVAKYSYAEGEADRVVLSVGLSAGDWSRSYSLDHRGDVEASAMAQLVSLPVSVVAEHMLAGKLPAGCHSAPRDAQLQADIWNTLAGIGVQLQQS